MLGKLTLRRKRPVSVAGACEKFGHVMVDSTMWGGKICKRCQSLGCCIAGTCYQAKARHHLEGARSVGFYRLGRYVLRESGDGVWRCSVKHEGAKVTLSSDTLSGLRNALIAMNKGSLSPQQLLAEMSEYDLCRLLELYRSRTSQVWPLDRDGFLLLHGLIHYGSKGPPSHLSWPVGLSEIGRALASKLFFIPYKEKNPLKEERSKWWHVNGPRTVYGLEKAREQDAYYLLEHESLTSKHDTLHDAIDAYKERRGDTRIIRALPDFSLPPSLDINPSNLWVYGCTEAVDGKPFRARKYYDPDNPDNQLTGLDLWSTL